MADVDEEEVHFVDEDEVQFVEEEEVVFVDDEDSDSSSDTHLRFHCVATWKIKNFSNVQLECGEELFSPMFSADSSAKVKWYLSIFPNGQTNFEEYLSLHVIFIRPSDSQQCDFRASCKVSIVDSESNEWVSDRREQNIERFEFNNFVKRERLRAEKNKAIPKDTLTILCQISALDERLLEPEQESAASESNVTSGGDLLKILADDFKELLDSGKFSDITLQAKDGEVNAHKILLAARSPVFEALLAGSVGRSVALPDCDVGTTRALLSHLYSGRVHPAPCLDLHAAADRYKVQELGDAVAPSRIDALTEITNETFTFTWRVRNFGAIAADNRCGSTRFSDRFHTGPSTRSWSLSLSLGRCPQDEGDRLVGLYLNKFWTAGEKKSVYVHFSLCLVDKDRRTRFTARAEKLCRQSGRYGFPGFARRSEILRRREDLLPDDTLTVRCHMSVCDGTSASRVEHSFQSSGGECHHLEGLSGSLGRLLSGGQGCDVTVCTTGKSFRLHKSVLCARSTVFGEFFETCGEGLANYTINITGIRPEILEMLFAFIYTGRLGEGGGLTCASAPALYMAANHYNVASLKRFCDAFMKRHACEILVGVSRSSDAQMKELVKDFVCSNAEHVFTTDQWPEFVRKHPRLSTDVLRSLSSVYSEAKRRKVE